MILNSRQLIRAIKAMVGALVIIIMLAPSIALASVPSHACIAPDAGDGMMFVGCACTQEECNQLCDDANYFGCGWAHDPSHPCIEKTCPDPVSDAPVEGAAGVLKPKVLENPLGSADTFQEAIGRVIRIFTGVSGSFALLMFVYGSFLLMTSRGEAAKVEKGKKAMLMAIAGLAIIFTAYAALTILFKSIGAS